MKRFAMLHPVTVFLYFLAVLIIPSVLRHPLISIVSFVFSLIYGIIVNKKAVRKLLPFIFLMSALMIAVNLLFNNAGVNVLFYLPSGNAVTLESAVYALFNCALIASLMLWCIPFGECVTQERVVYIFSRFMQTVGILLSVTLKSIPLFIKKLHDTSYAQRSFGISVSEGRLSDKIRCGSIIFGSAFSSLINDSADTATIMKSRGYGSGKRTVYFPISIKVSDVVIIAFTIAVITAFILMYAFSLVGGDYYPTFTFEMNHNTYFVTVLFAVFCFIPEAVSISKI